jgi:hypothetical protein
MRDADAGSSGTMHREFRAELDAPGFSAFRSSSTQELLLHGPCRECGGVVGVDYAGGM